MSSPSCVEVGIVASATRSFNDVRVSNNMSRVGYGCTWASVPLLLFPYNILFSAREDAPMPQTHKI